MSRSDHAASAWAAAILSSLAIPHFLNLYGLQIVARAVAVISWFAIVFTGKMPEGLATLQCLYIRYSNRAVTYAGFLREEYPPFAFDPIAPDPGNYPPVRTEFAPELDVGRLTDAYSPLSLE
jgi:Domain of unknown function (DUF4389)